MLAVVSRPCQPSQGVAAGCEARCFIGRCSMRADNWVREAQRESSLVNALYKARNLISMHNGITVQCDGEEWALDFGQELEAIDAALKTAGIDVARFRQ